MLPHVAITARACARQGLDIGGQQLGLQVLPDMSIAVKLMFDCRSKGSGGMKSYGGGEVSSVRVQVMGEGL